MSPESLIEVMAHAYLISGRFNGLPLVKLAGDEHVETRDSLRILVERGLATVVFGDIHPNPFIRALADEPKEETLRKLDERGFVQGNMYPTRTYLDTVVTPDQYAGRPYTLSCPLLSGPSTMTVWIEDEGPPVSHPGRG